MGFMAELWLNLWEMMGTDLWKTVSRNHKQTHFDHVNQFFGLILVIAT